MSQLTSRTVTDLADLPPLSTATIPEVTLEPTYEDAEQYQSAGAAVLRGLLTPDEVAEVRDAFQAAGDKGPVESMVDTSMLDPNQGGRDRMLRRFPRMMHPHRYPEQAFGRLAKQWMLDQRLGHVLTVLTGGPVLAAQSMYYFKPPQARGQGLHQDNQPLAVRPGTCHAAWIAVDAADADNGTLIVVPGSGKWDLICGQHKRTGVEESEFFDSASLALPDGIEPVPVLLNAGDVLLFNGQIVHGSYRNKTTDRWRRSLIFHYVPESCEEVAEFYHPLLDFEGDAVDKRVSATGGPCANWVSVTG